MIINLLVVNRETSKLRLVTSSSDWEVNTDYLSSPTSTFTLSDKIADTDIKTGDFIIGKLSGEKYWPTRTEETGNGPITHAFYYGMVDAYEDQKLTCRSIRDLVNMTGVIYSSSAEGLNNPAAYVNMLFYRYVKKSGYQTDHIAIDVPNNVAWAGKSWALTLDKPTQSNVLDVATDIFKDVQACADITGYSMDSVGVITFYMSFWLGGSGNFSVNADDSSKIHNFAAYIKEANYGVPNCLLLQDSAKVHGTFDIYYLTQSGTITQTLTSDVKQPVVPTSYYFDQASQTDPKPTKADVAADQLKVQYYQHEISMDVSFDHRNLLKLTTLGMGLTIVSRAKMYPSIITGYTVKSSSRWATINCGNIRTNLQTALS